MQNISVSNCKIQAKTVDEKKYEYYKNNKNFSEILSKILATKNIVTDEIDDFLNPKIKNYMPNPFSLDGMNVAVERIIKAIKNKENITLFGDYDVDGSSSVALLKNFFRLFNIDADIYIPNRILEGYGPNIDAMIAIKEENQANLIIMLDCGTMAFDPIKKANELNIDTIVIDHHKSQNNVPDCIAVVNPNKINDKSELYYLCACGVAFMTLTAINIELKKENFYEKYNISEPNLINFLDLVAIATVCDIVPLEKLNRAFIKTGLIVCNKKNNFGMKFLYDIAKLDLQIDTYHLGFILGPMINAGGRIGESDLGARLLSLNSKDETAISTAIKIAEDLFYLNQNRIKIEEEILNEIKQSSLVEKILKNRFVFEYNSNWHEGVIGIIASRMKDLYHYPSIIGSITKNDIIKCSARSVGNINIGNVTLKALDLGLIIKGGGHKMAAGFSLHMDKVLEFENFLISEISEQSKLDFENRVMEYDSEISLGGVNLDLCDELNKLEPHGMGNAKPVFLLKKVKIVIAKVLKDKHISVLLSCSSSKQNIWAISFRSIGTNLGKFLLSNEKNVINLIININDDVYLNERKVKINILDAHAN